MSRKSIMLACLTTGLLIGAPIPALSKDTPVIIGSAVVVDGHTIKLDPLSIRIHGIDAPEQGQTCQQRNGRLRDCGSAATAAMADMVQGKALTCEPLDTDAYGWVIARCLAGDSDMGRQMAALGLAWA
jgi:endonuclease YncB( thermonuclease family)